MVIQFLIIHNQPSFPASIHYIHKISQLTTQIWLWCIDIISVDDPFLTHLIVFIFCFRPKGDEESMLLLLAHGATLNACDPFGLTPLHYACWAGSLKVPIW